MKFFPQTAVGIDFHDYSAQLIEIFRENGKYFLSAYNRFTLGPGIIKDGEILKKDELVKILQKLLKEANPHPITCKNISVIFPSTRVFNHIFSYPANISEKEIAKSLVFEAETVIPFSLNDVYYDYTYLDKNDHQNNRESRILFSAIPKEFADKYTALMEELGITPTIFGNDIEALHFGTQKGKNPDGPTLTIDIGTLTVNYLIRNHEKILAFTSSLKGGKHLIQELCRNLQISETQALNQKENNDFSKEAIPIIQKFLEHTYKIGQKFLESNPQISPVKHIILTGEFLSLPGFHELAKKSFSQSFIHIGDPRNFLIIQPEKFHDFNLSLDKKAPFSTYFINAAGIAMRGLEIKGDDGINLLPDKIKNLRKESDFNLIKKTAAFLMTLITMFIASVIFFKHQELAFLRVNLEAQKSAVDKLLYGTRYQQIREEINLFNQEVSDLEKIDSSLFASALVLEKILSILPPGITVKSFTFVDEELAVNITGIAQNRDTLLKTQRSLKETHFVQEVITPLSSFDEKTDIPFSIRIKLIFKELPRYGATNF